VVGLCVSGKQHKEGVGVIQLYMNMPSFYGNATASYVLNVANFVAIWSNGIYVAA
jgi:hypothetical protein